MMQNTPHMDRQTARRRTWRNRIAVSAGRVLAALILCGLPTAPAFARTITLTDLDCWKTAVISSESPRAGWAGSFSAVGSYSNFYAELYPTSAVLIQFPLERIPAGYRITNAELTMPLALSYPVGEQRLYVRRLIAEWGAGVCHQYRMTRPKKVEWSQPGGRGAASDRVARPTGVLRTSAPGNYTLNVTQDVELWYSGEVPNYGWILTVDDPLVFIRLNSPSYSRGLWKLHVTYEPE